MSRVITFSRVFPAYHPKAGQPTNFIRKILKARYLSGDLTANQILKISKELGLAGMQTAQGVFEYMNRLEISPKHHTIRGVEKRRWNAGEKFSPRAWSGIPYRSKQISLGPDIEILDEYDVKISLFDGHILDASVDNPVYRTAVRENTDVISLMAGNDGLLPEDFKDWFREGLTEEKPFIGQIICWTPKLYA